MKTRKLFIISVALSVFSGSVHAAELENMLKRFKNDFFSVLTSPARLRKENLLALAAFSGGCAALMVLDDDIKNFSQDPSNRNGGLDSVFSFAEIFGNGYFAGTVCCGVYAAGLGLKNRELKHAGFRLTESFLITGAITTITKTVAGRARPNTGYGPFSYSPFSFNSQNRAFPSGHTSTAFSMATVIAGSYGRFPGICAYTAAALTGFSRIYYDWHWASDVFAGAVLGILVGRAVIKLAENKTGLSIVPYVDSKENTAGLALKYYFN